MEPEESKGETMEVDEEFSAFQEVTEEMIREKEEKKAEAQRLKR